MRPCALARGVGVSVPSSPCASFSFSICRVRAFRLISGDDRCKRVSPHSTKAQLTPTSQHMCALTPTPQPSPG